MINFCPNKLICWPFFWSHHGLFGGILQLRKHTEVIQLCEQSLGAAEKNFSSLGADGQFVDSGCSESESCSFARVWRWHLMSKSYFYMGKVEAALDLLEKLEQMRPISFK